MLYKHEEREEWKRENEIEREREIEQQHLVTVT